MFDVDVLGIISLTEQDGTFHGHRQVLRYFKCVPLLRWIMTKLWSMQCEALTIKQQKNMFFFSFHALLFWYLQFTMGKKKF